MELLTLLTSSAGNLIVGTLLPFFCVLIVVVFVHEMGHYLVGRWCGIGVKAFAIGFGPELFGYTDKHGTRWKFCAVPLGGYVKFVGDVGASSAPDSEELLALPLEERASAFQIQSLWKKALTVVAGPVANFILAIFIMTGFFIIHGKQYIAPIVGQVLVGSPAEAAGIKIGDQFVKVGGREIKTFIDVQNIVNARAGDPIDFVLDRGGEPLTLSMTPDLKEQKDALGNTVKIGIIGVAADKSAGNLNIEKLNFGQSIGAAYQETVRTIERTLFFLKRFASGREDRCQLGGPVKIAKMTGQAADLGVAWLVSLTAFLSIGIGIMNLLPIPPLDGGHLLLYGVEAVTRRPLHAAVQEWIYKVGFFAVMGFIGFVLWNDLFAC
jgi:regulator of sigma E protease